jgi:serine protease Do
VNYNVQSQIPFKSSHKINWALRLIACVCLLFVSSTEIYAQSELEKVQKETTSLARRVAGGVVSIGSSRRFGASGTGFLIADKWLISSTEVVGAVGSKVRLTFITGIKGEAEVKARDELSHFVLLELQNAKSLRERLGRRWNPFKLGDSSKLRPGHFVFTSGDPFRSLSTDGVPALSMGSITRIGRLSDGTGSYRGRVIEIDAAVNTGSFGGPLFDIKGRVVGMISSGYSKRRWFGTAVPINNFKSIRAHLKKGTKPRSGTLGLAVEDSNGLASPNGIKILDVRQGGAAEKAGLRAGDRLLSVDGNRVYDADDLAREMGQLPAGTVLQLSVKRADKVFRVKVELQAGSATEVASNPRRFGVYLGIALNQSSAGLTITKVKKNSPFLKAGVKKDDLLVRFAGKALSSTADLRAALKGRKAGDKIVVVISRGGWEKELTITLAADPGAAKTTLALSIGVRVRKDKSGGSVITSVAAKGPAAAAGLKKGDLLLRGLKGKQKLPINSAKDLRKFLKLHKAGDKAKFVVSRGGWEKEVAIQVKGLRRAVKKAKAKAWLGLRAKKTDAGLFLVTKVEAGGPAAAAGLKEGDIIKSINGKKIGVEIKLKAFLAKSKPGQKIKMSVSRDGWGRDLELTLGQRKN